MLSSNWWWAIYSCGWHKRQLLPLRWKCRVKWYPPLLWCFFFFQNGTVFLVAVVSTRDSFHRLAVGYVVKPNGAYESVTSCNLDLSCFSNFANLPTDYIFSFETGNDLFLLYGIIRFICLPIYCCRLWKVYFGMPSRDGARFLPWKSRK